MPRQRIKVKTKIEDPWKALSSAISDTLAAKESDLRLTMVMQACNDLVGKGKLNQIYDGLCDLLIAHFKDWHAQLINIAGDPLLTKLSDQFDYFKKYCLIFPTFYSSYDQYYSSEPNKILNTIRRLYLTEILSDEKLFKKGVTPSLLEVIYNAQKGSDVDLTKVCNIIEMYYSFNNKEDKPELFNDFFDRLKQQENDFCDTFYDNNFATSSFKTYLINASKQFTIISRIFNERNLLKENDSNEILTNFNISLLQSREDDFLKGEEPPIAKALEDPDLLPINYLVKTYIQFNFDTEPLYLSCAEYIKNQMLKKIKDFLQAQAEEEERKKKKQQQKQQKQNQDKKKKEKKVSIVSLVGQLIELVLNLSKPYKMIFLRLKEHKKVINALDENIKEAWNDKNINISDCFNDYIDGLIRNKFKGYDYEEQLEIIPQFYQYLTEKAKFNLFYESSFVRRLIQMRSSIEQYEYPLINRIQKDTTEFMKNLDNLKKALSDSEQLTKDFKEANPTKDLIIPFVFENNVFPLPKNESKNIPSEVKEYNSDFQKFYHDLHPKQSLTLVYHGSLVEFTLKIGRRTYQITMDLPCGCIFSALSNGPIKFGDIITLLNDDRSIARKVIANLSSKALITLIKKPKTDNNEADKPKDSLDDDAKKPKTDNNEADKPKDSLDDDAKKPKTDDDEADKPKDSLEDDAKKTKTDNDGAEKPKTDNDGAKKRRNLLDDDDDEIKLNPSFKSELTRLNIPPIIKGEWKANIPSVYEFERSNAIRFAIARILKQRRRMESGDLEREVIRILYEKYEITAEMIRRQVIILDKYVRSDFVEGQKIFTYIG